MRLWTIHPQYLDPQGLVAAWREALLAQKVLKGETKGYRHHPQLIRFQTQPEPLTAISAFLRAISDEADRRGYHFDANKITHRKSCALISETRGQLDYEWRHLLNKLQSRSPAIYEKFRAIENPMSHPLFTIVPGAVRDWEKR